MRVLLVTGLTQFAYTGVHRETERLVHRMLDSEVEVGLLADRLPPELAGADHLPVPYPLPKHPDEYLAQAIRAYRPDVMHVIGGGVRLMWAAHRVVPALPWVVTVHNVPPRERTARWLQGRNALHYPLRDLLALPSTQVWRRFLQRGNFHRAICHSDFVRDITRQAGCPARKLASIPLGCDAPDAIDEDDPTKPSPDNLFAPEDTPRLMSVGGLAHHKGFHDYLHAVARLVRDHPKLRYVIMGDRRDAQYVKTLERLIARFGLQDRVRLVPKASEAERLATALRADLYVVPSHEEGFCLSYLEGAMLSPRALGTHCGIIPQVADHDPAQQVVVPMDPAALEDATRRLLAVPVDANQLAQRRSALLDRYAWRHHTEAHLNLYRELVGVPAPAAV